MTLRRSREESELHESYARQGTGDLNGMSADDGDNRTRNAKAQRRHREKRKAHLKAVSDRVVWSLFPLLRPRLEGSLMVTGHVPSLPTPLFPSPTFSLRIRSPLLHRNSRTPADNWVKRLIPLRHDSVKLFRPSNQRARISGRFKLKTPTFAMKMPISVDSSTHIGSTMVIFHPNSLGRSRRKKVHLGEM